MQKLVRPSVHLNALRPVTIRCYGVVLELLNEFLLGFQRFLTLLGIPLAYVFDQKYPVLELL